MLNTVLIVDDTAFNRKIIKKILSKNIEDIYFLEANNGIEALEILSKQNISVIILDIMMPIMDGIETLLKIKKNPLIENIPVIMCSAVDEGESIREALELGALDYFTKPLTEEEIKITLPLKVKNAIEYYSTKKELIKYQNHMKEELHFAEQLQKALISEYKDFEKAEIRARYIPCEEVGGDIICTKEIDGNVWFIVADICGHGFSSAMMSTMLSVLFNARVEFCDSPRELLTIINNMFFEVFGGDKFSLISAFAGCLSENTLFYSNAGHPYPLIYRSKEKHIELLKENGFLLGMFQGAEYDLVSTNIETGDNLIIYTDGIYDNLENRNVDGWDSILEYCNKFKDSIEENTNKFIEDIMMFFNEKAKKKFIDDVALMIVKKK